MNPNETIVIEDGVLDIIESAVNKLVDTVRPTYGPASNKVIIDKMAYRMVVDDGVQIARDFELPDPAENAVVKIIRETAIRTNDIAGDGTTSSLIMLQAIIREIRRKTKINGRKIEIELNRGMAEVREQLLKSAKKIKTREELKKVALISFDDEKIADMLADLYFKLGKDATITIDKSPTMDTFMELADGIEIPRGYISPYMINNPERMETVLEKPYILMTDYRLMEATDLLPIMEKMAKANKRELVIICENLENSALATAVLNRIQQKFFTVAIPVPAYDNRKVRLEDIALMTGAKLFTADKGDKLENAELADLGRAERFICRKEHSIIIGPKGKKVDVSMAINSIRSAITNEQKEKDRKELEQRLAVLTNSLAVIKVGAPTENEQKALKYKVEDAVNAVKAAYKNGVVCGSGLALAGLKTSSPILNEALKYPARQLRENMGLDDVEYLQSGHAYNVVTQKVGPYLEVGVVDPVDVLIAGVQSAVSIASVLVTSCKMIVEKPKDKVTE